MVQFLHQKVFFFSFFFSFFRIDKIRLFDIIKFGYIISAYWLLHFTTFFCVSGLCFEGESN